MPISSGAGQFIVKYLLGTDALDEMAARMLGAQFWLQNQLARIFPSHPFGASNLIVVPRVATTSTSAFLGNTTADTDDSVPSFVTPALEIPMCLIEGDSRINDYASKIGSYSIDQAKLEIGLKKRANLILFWSQFFRPQFPQGFPGLPQLVDPTQVIQAGPNGGPLTLQIMNALASKVTEAMGEMDKKFFLMNSRAWLSYLNLMQGASLDIQYKIVEGMQYAQHAGVAILLSDYIPNDEVLGTGTGLTSIYCCTLGYQNNGLFAAYPPGVGEDGWVIEKAQDEARKDSHIYRVRLYTTLVLTQIKALARGEGIS